MICLGFLPLPPPKRILTTPLTPIYMSSELISCYGNHLLCHIFIPNILIESYTYMKHPFVIFLLTG